MSKTPRAKKPIIATTFSGVFVSDRAFKEAHKIGMKELADKAKMPEIYEAEQSPDYFQKVEKALEKVYPNLSPKERIVKRRAIYFVRVLDLMKKEDIDTDMINYFGHLKKKYRIALITTISSKAIDKFLEFTGLLDFFDIIVTTEPDEKDDKRLVWERFIKQHGKPHLYVGDSKRDFEICSKKGIEFLTVIEFRECAQEI